MISGTEYYDSLSERVIKYFNGYVVDWKYRLTDIKVRKSGPNIVSVPLLMMSQLRLLAILFNGY